MESDRNDEEIEVISEHKTLPAIFICNKCERIITDSTAWISLKQNLRAMITKGVTKNVMVKEGSITTDDHLASYYLLECTCKNIVGRMYKSTPKSLDDIRDMYTLDVDAMDSYQVGKLDIKPTDEMQGPTLPELQLQNDKIHSILVSVSDRLFKVEKKMHRIYQEVLPEEESDDKNNNESQTTADDTEVSDAESGIMQISHNQSKTSNSMSDNVRNSVNKSPGRKHQTPSSKGSSKRQTDVYGEKDIKPNIATLSKRKDVYNSMEKSAKRKKAV